MGQTIIGVGDAKAVQRFSGLLALDVGRKAFFTSKFMGKGEVPTKPIWQLTDLESDKGDRINFDLSMQLNMQPIEGDASLEGKEEQLAFYSSNVYIDQMRGGADTGGRMTRKRTLHDLRKIAKARSVDWWARCFDQIIFMYLSGARGTNTMLFPTTYTGFAGNSLTSPDTNHIVYGGVATSKATIAATDTMNTLPIDKAVAYAEMMGGGGPAYSEVPQLQKCNIDGDEVYLLIIDSWQKFDMRRTTTVNDWADIQKALAMSGKDDAFTKGAMGRWNDTIIQSHQGVIHYTDYGSGSVEASRALFLGLQAGVIAFGSPDQKLKFGWHEEEVDRGNRVVIDTHAIWGFIKTTFNGNDFGVIAIDTASKKP